MLKIDSKEVMFMNNIPVAIFTAMQDHLLEKAEGSFDRSAGCQSEWEDEFGSKFVAKMYLDLSYDKKDPGRTYMIEIQKNGDRYKENSITYYGGAKRPKDFFGSPKKSINMIMERR